MKQTAIQYLVEQLNLHEYEDVIIEAKEMEKQQIIDAYYEGKEYGFKEKGEEYYNETYGS